MLCAFVDIEVASVHTIVQAVSKDGERKAGSDSLDGGVTEGSLLDSYLVGGKAGVHQSGERSLVDYRRQLHLR